MRELGYLDELHFVLGDDDHDVIVRARAKGWVSGAWLLEFKTNLKYASVPIASSMFVSR